MKAITYQGPSEVAVEDVEEPTIQEPTDVIVDTRVSGLCGSDLHIYHGDTAGVEPGDTIGHELVGTVREVGDRISHVEEGDRVVASFQAPCGECGACQRGAFNGCVDLLVFGHGLAFGSLNGAQAETVRVPRAELTLRTIPENVSDEEALFAGDVLAAAYTGVRPWLEPGSDVVVVGAGPVGLLALEVASALGAAGTFAIDLDPDRARIAQDRGHVAPDPGERDPVSAVMDATGGEGAPLVVEAVGGEGQALESAFELVAPGGHVVALGVPTTYGFEYPWLQAFTQGVSLTSTLANVPLWIDEILALQSAGRLEASWLVSHRMALDEGPKAYELFEEHEALKVVFDTF